MRFKVKDSNLFQVPNNPHLLHLATIGYGLREFIVVACISGEHLGKCFIEEVVLENIDFCKDVFANCKFIKDDNLAFDLAKFAEEKGLTDMRKRFNELGDQGKLGWVVGNQDSKTFSMK